MAEAVAPEGMHYNSRGNLCGTVHVGLDTYERKGAHHYEIESDTGNGAYQVYVESLTPLIYRCTCMAFLFAGQCKHGTRAVSAERVFIKLYRDDYNREKRQQKHPSRKRR